MDISLIKGIKKVLLSNSEIIFAYIFGSFKESETFNDIDIAVYCSEATLRNPFAFTSDLKIELSQVTGYYPDIFDITIINYCNNSERADSLLILYEIFNGTLIIDKNPELRTDLIEKISARFRESAGILAEAYS
ncbi:MAG: hypothetical protein DRJ11_10695 [Candidatus Aminicenantes bacterium]|nr:MAG: hypothetical protein DRJ11_10695 [Candidatus Aminicenantes bacterium]